jgi:hypothetical protein
LCAGLLGSELPAHAQDDEALGFDRTPSRLSYVDGEVSFLRPGADHWTPARVNTPLAPGDELYASKDANLELQVGARAFVRAGERTQLALTSLEPDLLQLRLTEGQVSLDLRSLKTGQTFEIDTPNAAFVVEHSGYYRVEVDRETSTFASRRGVRGIVTPAAGDAGLIAASEQVLVSGVDEPRVETYAAPELDAWDRRNYARTDEQLDALSARYVPSDVYGVADLDHHGDWRVVPDYGPVWLPRHVPAGWAPYSTGRWLYDPYYGWTWVDDAPWGWALYHYGRWVHVSGYSGWCPGPIVVRPYYAPALVAFFGGGGFSIGITLGRPHIGWVALGWGEPLVPWWGPPRVRGYPRWAGWGGPRIVNDVVIKRQTVVKVKEIHVYRNARALREARAAARRLPGEARPLEPGGGGGTGEAPAEGAARALGGGDARASDRSAAQARRAARADGGATAEGRGRRRAGRAAAGARGVAAAQGRAALDLEAPALRYAERGRAAAAAALRCARRGREGAAFGADEREGVAGVAGGGARKGPRSARRAANGAGGSGAGRRCQGHPAERRSGKRGGPLRARARRRRGPDRGRRERGHAASGRRPTPGGAPPGSARRRAARQRRARPAGGPDLGQLGVRPLQVGRPSANRSREALDGRVP